MNGKGERGSVEQWAPIELSFRGPSDGNPFVEVEFGAVFECEGAATSVRGYYDGEGRYAVKFMPSKVGSWEYRTLSNRTELNGLSGSFRCVEPSSRCHGPVSVAGCFHFAYADGTRYLPFGTTCYAWTHQDDELQERTLATLASSPFNKIRMCVFPKHYDYNREEPKLFPYEPSAPPSGAPEGEPSAPWDFRRFNPAFFRKLERRIGQLRELGIEADLILFHPYDKWGFSAMGAEADDLYVRYIAARLSAYSNVWWSLANEYDLLRSKTEGDWERIASVLCASDPYGHLRSIHNCMPFYDHSKSWITHCSIQRQDVYKTAEYTDQWRATYKKPVVIDECAYEGDINWGWGNITGQELVRRCWEGYVRGGYVGHGETFLDPNEVLWWSKGGALKGESPARIAFLRTIAEEGPSCGISPLSFGWSSWDLPCGGLPGEYYLFYFGFNRPRFRDFELPEGARYRCEIIDTWDMTITQLEASFSGKCRITLPGKQYIALRFRKA